MPHSSESTRRPASILLPAAITALLLAAPLQAQEQPGSSPPAASPMPVPQERPQTFAPLAQAQLETVVNISTTQASPQAQAGPDGSGIPGMPQFPPGSPFGEFFEEFRKRQQQAPTPPPGPASALGSGFIIDGSGFVVTNNHVVSEASEIAVILHDGTRLDATLVGSDAATDLALLKVDSDRPLPATNWGDSDQVRVGDWVVAIGNPFGLGGSVTAGILSARARDIQQGPYDDYLQTDASINRGNSGGPLFNVDGQVIGINTAIYSPTGGSVGIGFAVPSAVARPIIEQLRDHGRVRRGWLGVQVQRVTPDIADSLGLSEPEGALVTSVDPASPAGEAGLRQGDVITAFAGQTIERMRSLPRVVAATEIGKTVDVAVMRDGASQTVQVTVGELAPPEEQIASSGSSGEPPAASEPTDSKMVMGLKLAPLTPVLRETFSIGGDVEGVVVTDVGPDSPASDRGIDPGDVILEASQEPVRSPDELQSRINQAREQGRKTVLMLVSRNGDLRYVPVPVAGGRG
ncbi:DegQ family serine endoprotease [Azospirillum sp. SYSU D00513]|uniref:DegQ family serine endoprotease n=1 Tax=Azospirillum sp. SYSU D00513 TaxID=2812561 RepID=UPI001A97724C|nr:DegQ family serine endoprotease [Azospirillum sp. SYSU D00513]